MFKTDRVELFDITDDFICQIEYLHNEKSDSYMPMLHLEIKNPTIGVIRYLKKECWPDLLEYLYYEGYDHALAFTPSPKFVKLLGGGNFLGAEVVNGVYKECWVWEL